MALLANPFVEDFELSPPMAARILLIR